MPQHCYEPQALSRWGSFSAHVIVSDYTTLMVEILKDNARPDAGEVDG